MGMAHSLQAKSEEVPQVQGKERRVDSHSIGAMDCYVTGKESEKQLTSLAVLSLIVLVVTVTVLLPVIAIPPPPPCKE